MCSLASHSRISVKLLLALVWRLSILISSSGPELKAPKYRSSSPNLTLDSCLVKSSGWLRPPQTPQTLGEKLVNGTRLPRVESTHNKTPRDPSKLKHRGHVLDMHKFTYIITKFIYIEPGIRITFLPFLDHVRPPLH